MRTVAIVAALVVHVGVVGAVWGVGAMGMDEPGHEGRRLEAIEAGLAFRKKSAQGQKKSRLPQKKFDRAVKAPDGPTLTRDDTVKPPKEKTDKDSEPPPPDMIDPSSVFDKYRNLDTPGKEALVGEGTSDDSQEGTDEGSDYGTLEDAEGHPYVGELVGRLTTNPDPEIPSLVPKGTGLVARVCLRMASDGRIASLEMPDEMKSSNSRFNSAVYKRARETSGMPTPVPNDLNDLLVERGICIGYKY